MKENENRIFLTPQQANDCLIVKNKQVHNFICVRFGLIGADMNLMDVQELLDNATSIEIGGEHCRNLGHGIVAIAEGNKTYFFEADNNKIDKLEKEITEKGVNYVKNKR